MVACIFVPKVYLSCGMQLPGHGNHGLAEPNVPRKPITQALMDGDMTFAGMGDVREVYLARYRGDTVAIKILLKPELGDQPEIQEQEWEMRKLLHWVEVVSMSAVSPGQLGQVRGGCQTPTAWDFQPRWCLTVTGNGEYC